METTPSKNRSEKRAEVSTEGERLATWMRDFEQCTSLEGHPCSTSSCDWR